jgi:hypothetical protein
VSDVDFLWRQGQARMLFVVSDVDPVPAHTGSKRLGVDNGDVTLYMEDGRWTLGSVSLYGAWLRKDGTRGKLQGSLSFLAPLTVEPAAPVWLQHRMAALLAHLNVTPGGTA